MARYPIRLDDPSPVKGWIEEYEEEEGLVDYHSQANNKAFLVA